MSPSKAVTHGVRVEVESQYVSERSDPGRGRWFYAYRVEITNDGSETVQLVSRHWIITDARGGVDEVKGPGVVGEQPVLAPGASFEYVSGCPLATSFGVMHGTYQMKRDDGTEFDAEIAPFTLGEPAVVH